MRWLVLLMVLSACGRTHGRSPTDAGPRLDAAAAPDAARRVDAGSVREPDACVPEPPPDVPPPTPTSCTVPFTDADCDGMPDIDYRACPMCPAVRFGEMHDSPCMIEGYACRYEGPGWCNFWGCDCAPDPSGVLRWQCWAPLC